MKESAASLVDRKVRSEGRTFNGKTESLDRPLENLPHSRATWKSEVKRVQAASVSSRSSFTSPRSAANSKLYAPHEQVADVGVKLRSARGTHCLIVGMTYGGPAEESKLVLLHDTIEAIENKPVSHLSGILFDKRECCCFMCDT